MTYYNQLSQEELRDKIKQIIARDSARLANTGYLPYPGKTISPMSSLTQRAQMLEEQRSRKGMPYKSALDKVANTEIQGISPNDLEGVLSQLKNKQIEFGKNVVGGGLSNQFGRAFIPYRDNYERKLTKDTDLRLNDTRSDVNNLNRLIKQLEGKQNSVTFDAIANSSKSKNARQTRLINDLYKYGEQKHGITNKNLTADRARFEAERNEPYERLYNLQQALNGIDTQEDHPDLSASNAENLKKALVVYGIDVGKPVNEWGYGDRFSMPVYQGKIMEPINSDMNTSYKLIEGISPSYQDKNYNARKQIRNELADSSSSMSGFVGKLPEQLKSRFELLDAEAKKKAKADLTALNSKYIKRGMYGGQSHIQSASDRMREINDASLTARSNTLKNELEQGVNAVNTDAINKIGKLSQYDQLANTEFNDMLSDIKRTNTTGLEKWKNDQAANEQLYKAYQNEKGYQQPRLLGNARATGAEIGINGMFGHFANQGINLGSISDLQNRYNNLEKELQVANDKIKNQEDYQRAINPTVEDLQRAYEEAKKRYAESYESYKKTTPNTPSYYEAILNKDDAYNQDWLAKKAFEVGRMKRNMIENLKQYSSEEERQKAREWNDLQIAKTEKWYDDNLATVRRGQQQSLYDVKKAFADNEQWKEKIRKIEEEQARQRSQPTTTSNSNNESYRILNHPEIVKRRRISNVVGNTEWNDPNYAKAWLQKSGLSW